MEDLKKAPVHVAPKPLQSMNFLIEFQGYPEVPQENNWKQEVGTDNVDSRNALHSNTLWAQVPVWQSP